MTLLIVSLAMLALSPLVYHGATRFKRTWGAIERVLALTVTFLVVIHLLPESILIGGKICAVFALVGLFLPSMLEHIWHDRADKIHIASLAVALLGLALHGMMDGAALATRPGMPGANTLPMAVILHRLPVGVLIWSIFIPRGWKVPAILLTAEAIATIAGFSLGEVLLPSPGSPNAIYVAYFQSIVAGSLLHAGFDHH